MQTCGNLRLGRDDIRWLRSARLKYGPDVRVIDISAGGILVETDGQLRPGSSIVFELSGPQSNNRRVLSRPERRSTCDFCNDETEVRLSSFTDFLSRRGFPAVSDS